MADMITVLGRPSTPMFGDLISGPSAGKVTIMIKTVASGLEDPSQVFWFVITPIRDGVIGQSVSHFIRHYQSGSFVSIIMDGLEHGEKYTFNATATNIFGDSGSIASNSILSGIESAYYIH